MHISTNVFSARDLIAGSRPLQILDTAVKPRYDRVFETKS
ncbi:MAG: palindromic element RPE4 domain-containing protein [Gammaproteobacteria bacterium]|nr:palindromic element RPE4 domain-containing protein [Gammaproteobacteria bacterium]